MMLKHPVVLLYWPSEQAEAVWKTKADLRKWKQMLYCRKT